MSDDSVRDAIEAAKDGQPLDVKGHVHDALRTKLADAINIRKIEISSSLIQSPNETADETTEG